MIYDLAILSIAFQITKIQRVIHETKNHDFVTLAGSAGFLLSALQAGLLFYSSTRKA